jgi:predicted amidohydrolase
MKRILRLALIQMSMDFDLERNLQKSLNFMEQAKQAGADLIFFPEIQLSRFFPQFPRRKHLAKWVTIDDPVVQQFQKMANELQMYCSPNIYLKENESLYDASPSTLTKMDPFTLTESDPPDRQRFFRIFTGSSKDMTDG